MKRRLMIARALMHEPRLLILDEPTAGVDIEIRRSMWDFLREINERGTTIILTTHYLEEAETLCRNIAIIDGGRIVERDRMSSLLRRLHTRDLRAQSCATRSRPRRRSTATPLALIDDHTLEVEVSKEQNLNDIFARLSRARHRSAEHAQQGQPPGGDLHAPGGGAWRPTRSARARAPQPPEPRACGSAAMSRVACADRRRCDSAWCAGSASRPSSSASTGASSASGARPSCRRW